MKTSRQRERNKEDYEYEQVIIKRNDQGPRHPDDVLEFSIEEGLEQHKKSSKSLFLSSTIAGFIMSFTVLNICFAMSLSEEPSNIRALLVALFYPLSFIMTVLSGTQLFTEQTATAIYPVLEKKVRLGSLARLYSVVLSGNFLGTALGSYGLINISSVEKFVAPNIPIVAKHLLESSGFSIILSSVFAGFLMAQGGWLVMSMLSSLGQIVIIFLVTFIIAIGGFYHSIAGSAELFTYLFLNGAGDSIFPIVFFLSLSVLGNILGGSIFVGVLNFTHIRKIV